MRFSSIPLAGILVMAAGATWAGPRPGAVVVVPHEAAAERPTLGPRHAPVTIEFFVGSGSSSSRLYRQLRTLHERHPTRLTIVFRFAGTDKFSNAARVAFRRGRFRALTDALYGGKFPRRNQLEEIVTGLEFDWQRFSDELDAPYHQMASREDRYYGRRWGIRRLSSTRPYLLINGREFRSRRRSVDTLEQAYDDAYKDARLLLERGVAVNEIYTTLKRELVDALPPLDLPIGQVDGALVTQEEREAHPVLAGPIRFDLAHSLGPADAPVTLAWFCSLQSSACSRLFRNIKEIRKAYPSEVRISFFHAFDPSSEQQRSARLLHRAALCAEVQGNIWDFMAEVYARRPSGQIEDGFLERIAETLDLDSKALLSCTKSPKTATKLREAASAAGSARITRTPTVVVGGLAYLGYRDFSQLARMIETQHRQGTLGRSLSPARSTSTRD